MVLQSTAAIFAEGNMSRVAGLHIVGFGETLAVEVIHKLRREIARIDNSTNLESATDHIINAFTTAWQVHAWMWDVIKDKPELKAAVLNYRGIQDAKIDNQRAFGIALAHRFVPLKLCRAIATSPTHPDVVFASDASSEISHFDAAANDTGGVSLADTMVMNPVAQKTPMVMIMGRPIAATRLLQEIDDYWVTLITECGIHR